ncbi:MAG: SOS response-associated peptidase family protein [Xanthobacteraceae bacterium]
MGECILPVDGFFEWKAIKGQRAKQPYAIGMRDGTPFGLGGLWENWKDPGSGEWVRTFAIITTDANGLVAEIHDRMPLIIAPGDYARWLGEEPEQADWAANLAGRITPPIGSAGSLLTRQRCNTRTSLNCAGVGSWRSVFLRRGMGRRR